MPTYIDHSKGFAVGDKVGLEQNGAVRFVKVLGKERLSLRYTGSSVSTGGTATAYTELTDLDPQEGELYYIQNIQLLRGNVTFTIRQPGAITRFGTNRQPERGEINILNDDLDLDLFVLKSIPPHVSFQNNAGVAITPRLKFHGYKYVFSDIPKPGMGEPVTIVNVAGIKS